MLEFLKSTFLKNTGLRQTIVKNTFWLAAAEAVVKVLGTVLVIYMARVLGAAEYGKFTFALSFVSVMSILSDLGIIEISTREFSRHKDNEAKFPGIFTLGVLLCLFALTATVVGSFFITRDSGIRILTWVLAIFVLSNTLVGIMFSFLRARQNMEYEAGIKIFQSLLTTMVVLGALWYAPSLASVMYGYVISGVVVLVVLLILFHRYFQSVALRWERQSLKMLKNSWPLSFGFSPSYMYLLINSVMLGYLGLITENGWYGAASKIALASAIPITLVTKSFYPALSKLFVDSQESLQKAWSYLAGATVVVALPIVAGGIALAPSIIATFYGSGFAPSALALQLFMVVMAISFLNYPYTIMLVVADQQKKNFILMAAGALVNVVLSFLFISRFGFYGTIMATIISSLLVFIATIRLCQQEISMPAFPKDFSLVMVISSIATLVMVLFISLPFMRGLNVILIAGMGAVSYGVMIAAGFATFFTELRVFIIKKLKN
jgi:O-antigen/teichoic acid export membrane protein